MIVLIAVLLALAFLGVPIGYALGAAGLSYFLVYHPELLVLLPERLFSGMNSSLLIALPLFMMMGLFMNEGNLTRRMIDLLMMLIGRVRGALGLVNVLVSMVFGGISGSSVSDTASVGAILIPEMERKGYSVEFACGCTVASSTMGMIIPPSIPMLLYASLASESVGKLFMGGLIPGVAIGIIQCLLTYRYAKRANVPIEKVEYRKEYVKTVLKEGILAIIMPLVVIGFIVGGICTATEAAGIGALYALVVGKFVYHSLDGRKVWKIAKETVRTSATIMIIIAFSCMFTWILTLEGVTAQILALFAGLHLSQVVVMLLCGLIILLAGCFLDVSPVIMLFTPVLLPVVTMAGGSAIQLGALMIVGTAIGLVTPPVGMCLNVASTIAKRNILFIFRSALPFLLANLIVMLLISVFPFFSEWLPGLFA